MSGVGGVYQSASTVVPSTGRRTFGVLKTQVAQTLGRYGDDRQTALIGEYFKNVIDDLNKRLWQFNLIKDTSITTVAGTAAYSVPTDLWEVYSSRNAGSIDYPITGVSRSSLDIIFQSQGGITGYPYARADFNIYRDGTIELFPTPDAAYPIVLRYFKLISTPSGDGDLLDMPAPYQTVPLYGATAQMAAATNHPRAQYWEMKYQQEMSRMEIRDEYQGDEDLRFVNADEFAIRNIHPSVRPRYLDFY